MFVVMILVWLYLADTSNRPDCYWGRHCRTQINKPQHARYVHLLQMQCTVSVSLVTGISNNLALFFFCEKAGYNLLYAMGILLLRLQNRSSVREFVSFV